MSAKNSAVNLMILTTFISFVLYRRGNKIATVSWAKAGNYAQIAILALSTGTVIFYGIYGYMVEAIVRVGFSIYQVASVLIAIISISIIDIFLYRKAKVIGQIKWGEIPVRSQYVLLLVAVTFTWLMGLMGFARSAMRQHWHVYGVLRDNSPDAYTPAIGYAANVVSVITIVFVFMLLFIFWLGSLGDKKKKLSAKELENVTLGQKSSFWTIVKGLSFVVALIGFFTLYSNSIPQLQSKVPEDIVISTDGLTQSSLIQLGKKLFINKGNCQVCHKDTSSRAPSLNTIGSISETRKPGMSSKDYLIESLENPSAFVVEGFGPIMPAADKPPISLNKPEILAIVAYLQSCGGVVTVTPEELQAVTAGAPTDNAAKNEEDEPVAATGEMIEIKGDAESGKTVFMEYGCIVCHNVVGEDEKIGPNLFTIGLRASAGYIRESIIYPDAKINKGYKFKMPYYSDKLSVREFDDLMTYLLNLKGGK